MDMNKQFPIHQGNTASFRNKLRELKCPKTVPWHRIAPYEQQARKNHDQTLERLAERGGLDPFEILAVVSGFRWDYYYNKFSLKETVDLLLKWLREEWD